LLHEEPGTKVQFDQVLLIGGEKDTAVGHPLVGGARVEATVLGDLRDEKLVVFKKKKRKGYRVKRGHRQAHTRLEITKIAK
jgi:large subunit ribosomal protein L21